ncbi:MAG: GspE/PulE family protein [bacterium]|nr:GspE/PulE family protein [bacterium]
MADAQVQQSGASTQQVTTTQQASVQTVQVPQAEGQAAAPVAGAPAVAPVPAVVAIPAVPAVPAQQAAASAPATQPATSAPAATAAAPAETPAPPAKIAPTKEELAATLKQLQDSVLAANIPQLVMIAISYALDGGSSDIHIEPQETHVRIRYRIDGVLHIVVEYPNNLHPAVVSRVKIMSNLKIDEQRLPQDGRAEVTTKEGREMDLRVSTLPTVNGEKIVMRIQDKSKKIPSLDVLGITGIGLKNLEDALQSPNGILINTGPTGSGKTTTLYACLTRLNKPDVNIMTIEDPVEIGLDGLNQSQVHHDIEYDFASGMRCALRQDPDIIMVGEIRDKETGTTAIEAALTGHLVFSTLHTNSAVESITRIINMGIQPYLITSTIELIIAQRLVRRLCEKCKKPAETSPDLIELVKNALGSIKVEGEVDPALAEKLEFFEPVGCEECGKVGYKGRVGLYEVFRMNNELRKLIEASASVMDIQVAAQKNGMITLEQAGIIKALEGMTSLDEVYRVARKAE